MTQPGLQHATPAVRVFGGERALDALPRELDRLGLRRAVLFFGRSMLGHDAALARVESALGARLAGRFDGVREHSPTDAVEAGRRALEEWGADSVVALGGGSAVVTARAASILLAERRDVRELCTRRDPDGRLVSPHLGAPKLPQWVVPSTPNTAYAKAGSAVRDPATGERLALYDPKTRARAVFLDPVVAGTASVPLVLGSALTALSMAIEGVVSRVDDPLADALLLHGLRMCADWLPRALDAPDDTEPRLRLMAAALLAGQGSDYTGGGLAQALSHAVGPISSVSNGVVHGLLLPATLRYAAPVAATSLAPVGEALGSPDGIAAVERLLARCGVPARLRDVGVDRDALGGVVDHVLDDWTASRAPRDAGRDELLAILQEAW